MVDGIYDGDSDTYVALMGESNSARMPQYQKVDLHLERRFVFQRWRMSTYFEAWWVPAPANYLYPAYSYDYSESALVRGLAFVPLVGARMDF